MPLPAWVPNRFWTPIYVWKRKVAIRLFPTPSRWGLPNKPLKQPCKVALIFGACSPTTRCPESGLKRLLGWLFKIHSTLWSRTHNSIPSPRGLDYKMTAKLVVKLALTLELGLLLGPSLPLALPLLCLCVFSEGREWNRQKGPTMVWHATDATNPVRCQMMKHFSQLAPEYPTKGCSHWFVDSPGSRTLVLQHLCHF